MDKWVISLSGERGKGPWDKAQSSPGSTVPATEQREAYPWRILDLAREECRQYRTHGHPHAKVFRLVRRSKAKDASAVPAEVHESGWQWRPVGDGAFAPPFGTIRVCDCGCLVAGGPTRCVRCADDKSYPAPTLTTLERAVVEAAILLVESNAAVAGGSGALTALQAAVAALRAKRGG